VEVRTIVPSVITKVAIKVVSATLGRADACSWRVFASTGEYVLVPKSEETIAPGDAGTEVLKP